MSYPAWAEGLINMINIPQQQYLIYWKRCQHIHCSSMDYYWKVNNHIDIWSLWEDKTGIFPSCNCASTTVWSHHFDFNNTLSEKISWEPHKHAASSFELIQEASPNKMETLWPLTSHLTNHPSKMCKIC